MLNKRSLAATMALALVAGFAACDDSNDSSSPDAGGGSGGSSASGGTPGTGGGTPGSGGTPATGGAAGTPGSGGMPGTGGATALKDIVDTAAANPDFSSLVAAVQKAELVTTLKGAGPFTVFAPTNAAFNALFTSLNTNLNALTKEALTPILTYHVVAGKVQAADVAALKGATTVNGADIRIKANGGKVFLTAGNGSDVEVTMTDIQATNGVIHVINKVMLPPKDIAGVAAANPDFSILVQALTRANLVDAVKAPGPLTVFAPTNAAFNKLLESNNAWNTINDIPLETLTAVLKYHVVASKAYSETVVTLPKVTTLQGKDVTIAVNGGAVKLNGNTNVTAVDVLASNGVIHVIDSVLLPPN